MKLKVKEAPSLLNLQKYFWYNHSHLSQLMYTSHVTNICKTSTSLKSYSIILYCNGATPPEAVAVILPLLFPQLGLTKVAVRF